MSNAKRRHRRRRRGQAAEPKVWSFQVWINDIPLSGLVSALATTEELERLRREWIARFPGAAPFLRPFVFERLPGSEPQEPKPADEWPVVELKIPPG